MRSEKNKNISIICIDNIQDIDNYKNKWNRLAAENPPHLVTCSHAYVSTYIKHFLNSGERFLLYFAFIDDALVGVLPLILEPRRSKIKGHYSILRAPFNCDTFGVGPTIPTEYCDEIFNKILSTVWRNHPEVRYIEINDISTKSKLGALFNQSTHIRKDRRIGRYIPCSGNFQDHMKMLSKNFRSNQRKAQNKLEKLPNVSFEIISDTSADNQHLFEFANIESLSWKGQQGTAIQCSDNMMAFYTDLCSQLSQQGWLEWHILRADNKTIAKNLAIRFHESVFLVKLGYDEAYSKYSPGGMLLQYALEHAFNDDQIKEFDILTNEPWYDNWKMHNREYLHVRIYNNKRTRSFLAGYIPDKLIQVARNNPVLRSSVRAVRNQLKKVQA